MSVPTTDLAQRYGAPSRGRRRALVAAVVVVALAGLGWLAWVVAFHGRPEVTSQLVGFEVRGEHRAVATYTVVRRDTGRPASCLLQALATDHAVVGERTVSVTGSEPATRLRTAVRTEREATTVDLLGCTAPGQPQRH